MAVHMLAAEKVPRQPRRKPATVTTMQVQPRVWELALRLAQDRSRLLRVLDDRHVRVLDARYRPPRWP
jgi:hypothetical protein